MVVATGAGERTFAADAVVSTIPLPALARLLDPAPAPAVLAAAAALGFRDLVLAAVAVDRPFVTDQTWIYLPDRAIPFGRIHEPKNWSRAMAPPERSLVVAEYFCFRGDAIWESPDARLEELTVGGLERLGYLEPARRSSARGSCGSPPPTRSSRSASSATRPRCAPASPASGTCWSRDAAAASPTRTWTTPSAPGSTRRGGCWRGGAR